MTGKGGSDDRSFLGPQCYDSKNYWNQKTKNDVIEYGKDTYLAIIIDPSETEKQSGKTLDNLDFEENLCIRQDIFIGDKKVLSGWYNKNAWDLMISNKLSSLKKFCLGECSMGQAQKRYYSHLDCYSLRFYNRALTDEEVYKNYDKTIEYHKILESQSKNGIQQ